MKNQEMQNRIDEASRFLSCLFDGYQSGWLEMRAFRREGESVVRRQDFKAIPLRSIPSLAAEIVRLSDVQFDVYIGVLPREEKRGVAESVRRARWMWADLDSKTLTSSQQSAAVEECDLAVDSGYGTHCYWSLGEEMLLPGFADRETFCRVMRAIQKKTSDDTADNVSDLPRILRVPGTWNWKRGQKVPVRLLKHPALPETEAKEEDVSPLGDSEWERIQRGITDMVSAAQENALPALHPAWRSCRGHVVNDPNVWTRGQITWFQFMLKHQQSIRAIDDPAEAVRRGAIVDACVAELTDDFTSLFLTLEARGYDPTGWRNNPLFTMEDMRGN